MKIKGKREQYRMEKFDQFVKADLTELLSEGMLRQKRYPFPVAEKFEISYKMFVDHAGLRYWRVREQVRGAMMYLGMDAKEAVRLLSDTTLGQYVSS